MVLLDGPGFPYAVVTRDPADRVHGDLLTIRADLHEEVLNRLDALEGVRPGGGGLYDRVTVEAMRVDRHERSRPETGSTADGTGPIQGRVAPGRTRCRCFR